MNTEVLQNILDYAVAEIMDAETELPPTRITQKIMRCINKAPKFIDRTSWENTTKKFINEVMRSYSEAYHEKAWFYEIDLAPTFAQAALELIGHGSVNSDDLLRVVRCEYNHHVYKHMLNDAIWKAANKRLTTKNGKKQLYDVLTETHEQARKKVQAEKETGIKKRRFDTVKSFLQEWIGNAMQNARSAVINQEKLFTEPSITELVQDLIWPLGDSHPFSCIPDTFIDKTGKPPSGWTFVDVLVKQLGGHAEVKQRRASREGQAAEDGDTSKKRRARSGGHDETTFTPPRGVRRKQEEVEEEEEKEEKEQARVEGVDDFVRVASDEDGKLEGRWKCTNAKECEGSPNKALVQHMINNTAGNMYCLSCWRQFLLKNNELEAVYVTGPRSPGIVLAADLGIYDAQPDVGDIHDLHYMTYKHQEGPLKRRRV